MAAGKWGGPTRVARPVTPGDGLMAAPRPACGRPAGRAETGRGKERRKADVEARPLMAEVGGVIAVL
jgi:hypothetical protein